MTAKLVVRTRSGSRLIFMALGFGVFEAASNDLDSNDPCCRCISSQAINFDPNLRASSERMRFLPNPSSLCEARAKRGVIGNQRLLKEIAGSGFGGFLEAVPIGSRKPGVQSSTEKIRRKKRGSSPTSCQSSRRRLPAGSVPTGRRSRRVCLGPRLQVRRPLVPDVDEVTNSNTGQGDEREPGSARAVRSDRNRSGASAVLLPQ